VLFHIESGCSLSIARNILVPASFIFAALQGAIVIGNIYENPELLS
jgi:hypothetical protein